MFENIRQLNKQHVNNVLKHSQIINGMKSKKPANFHSVIYALAGLNNMEWKGIFHNIASSEWCGKICFCQQHFTAICWQLLHFSLHLRWRLTVLSMFACGEWAHSYSSFYQENPRSRFSGRGFNCQAKATHQSISFSGKRNARMHFALNAKPQKLLHDVLHYYHWFPPNI